MGLVVNGVSAFYWDKVLIPGVSKHSSALPACANEAFPGF